MKLNRSIIIGIAFSALAVAACGRDKAREAQYAQPEPATQPESELTPAAGVQPETTPPQTEMPPATEETPPAPATPEAPAMLAEPEIVAIVVAVNQGEIEEGKLAQKKAKHQRVKKFAQMMINHHTESQKKQDKVTKKLGLTPAESNALTELKTSMDSNRQRLDAAASGTEFDNVYIQAQVTEHRDVLDLIDRRLMPSVQSAELKTFLNELRDRVDQHLTEAREIQEILAKMPSGDQGTNKKGTTPPGGTSPEPSPPPQKK